MKLIKKETETEGDKRQHFPYVLETNCPKCNNEIKRDYERDHLSYPIFGKEVKEYLYCDECEHEWYFLIKPSIKLELVTKNDSKH